MNRDPRSPAYGRENNPRHGSHRPLDAWVDQAARHHNAGRFVDAEALYRKILELQPDWAEAHNNLANALGGQGKLEQAVTHYGRALAIRPDYAEAHNNLGNTLKIRGQLEQAITAYRKALAVRPDFVEAHYNLASVLHDQGELEPAAAGYERALALRPQFALAHNNLGNVRRSQGQIERAVAHFQQALVLQPNFAAAYNNLGAALDELGRSADALACYRRASALDPNFAEVHNNLANALKDRGQFGEAAAHYRRALELDPNLTIVHCNRADLQTFRAGDAELAALEVLAADADRLPADKAHPIHFALSKALDDIGDYDRAFQQMLRGNALKRQLIAYDSGNWQQAFREIPDVFQRELFDRLKAAGDPSPLPIFVLGMPRSGSTLIEQILASHPQVHGAGELKYVSLIANNIRDPGGRPLPYPQWAAAMSADGLHRLGAAYLANLPALPPGKQRITDKTPMNFAFVGLIRLILPGARIIHTLRDPVDTCLSCFSKLFAAGQSFSYDLAELGRFYRGYRDVMAHWRSVLPSGAMLEISYESVVDDLEQQARRLIEFCGLTWDERCLSFHQTSRPITTASSVQVRRPLYRTSGGAWRRYEKHLGPLLAELEA